VAFILTYDIAYSCTNFLISKGASKDGSVMITYAADSHELYGELYYYEGKEHLDGEMLDVYEWDTGDYLGQIKQVKKTYTVVGNMNEYQVAIGETTFGGRKELKGQKDGIDYGSLIYIALQRSKTAKEAIKVMTDLVKEYGYASSGESFSISDKNEVWIMEMIGKGKGKKGAVWVARKVPDGYICAHANQARIRKFPLNDKENCLYSPDVISFAKEMGFFKGEDKDFSFADTYAPLDFGALRFCEARVYAMFNRAAPSLNLSSDYAMGDKNAKPLPLWIKPDKKLSVRDVLELMRDHYEGTLMDMTKDVGAGAYCLPYRWRPLTWEYEGKKYFNERAISTQQTGFSFLAQSRTEFPNAIGGVLWFSVDDTYSTVYFPVYCGVRAVPESYSVNSGDFSKFSWNSAFWVFNFVSNFAYGRYSEMIVDIQKKQRELEGMFFAKQMAIEQQALTLYKQSPEMARRFLTEYSCKQGETVVKEWRKLGEFLIWKYLDGNLRDEHGRVKHPGYPKSWYKKIVDEKGKFFEIKE
jgi:dipeptidase